MPWNECPVVDERLRVIPPRAGGFGLGSPEQRRVATFSAAGATEECRVLLWLMGGIVVSSAVLFVALLLHARQAAKRHTADGLAVEQELAERSRMPAEAARAAAERLIAAHAVREPWDGRGAQTVARELATLGPDIEALLAAQKRLVFSEGEIVLSADYIRSGAARVPAGMSQIGFADNSQYALCAYQDRRPDVVSLRVSDGRLETSFKSIHHCILVLADPDLGKRASD